MELNLREQNSDTRALADQAYAASAEDEPRCLQSWLPRGVRYAIGGTPECQGTTVPNPKRNRIESLMSRFLKGECPCEVSFCIHNSVV